MLKRILTAFIALSILGLAGCKTREELKKTRQMPIESVDLASVKDGSYQGAYSYGGSDFLVQVTVKDHKIEEIDILKAFTGTPPSKKAQAILDTVIAHQSLDVDVITGATTTSKAYLKCIENALREGLQ
jgi:uncharacterized protein with FMN-binding domain